MNEQLTTATDILSDAAEPYLVYRRPSLLVIAGPAVTGILRPDAPVIAAALRVASVASSTSIKPPMSLRSYGPTRAEKKSGSAPATPAKRQPPDWQRRPPMCGVHCPKASRDIA